jgi:lipoate-protein ligase B
VVEIEYSFLSTIGYKEALDIQLKYVRELKSGSKKNYLLFLEHKDVITKGIRGGDEDLLLPPEELKTLRIEYMQSDRGGSLTAHGPGQLVMYTIFDLYLLRLSAQDFIMEIVEIFQDWLLKEGINAIYNKDHPGLYVSGKKILSLGLRIIQHHITYHGFALNLNSIPVGFRYINPCSMKDCVMTSVYLETFKKYDIQVVSKELYNSILKRFRNIGK